MPRNGSGTYSLPVPPFSANTKIVSADVNSDFSDIGAALTASLARDGQGPMTAILPMHQTGWTYSVDPDTGMSRSAANTQVVTCGGTTIGTWSTTGLSVTGTFAATGVITGGSNGALGQTMIGEMKIWAGATAPSGWQFCDGRAISRTTYATLFSLIGTFYGAGDGSTTFNLPDARGRVIACPDNMGGSNANRLVNSPSMAGVRNTLGGSGGEAAHTLSTAELPVHTPAFTGTNGAVSVNSTGGNLAVGAVRSATYVGGGGVTAIDASSVGTVTSTGFFTPSGTISSIGSGNTHENVQPTLLINMIIYLGAP